MSFYKKYKSYFPEPVYRQSCPRQRLISRQVIFYYLGQDHIEKSIENIYVLRRNIKIQYFFRDFNTNNVILDTIPIHIPGTHNHK